MNNREQKKDKQNNVLKIICYLLGFCGGVLCMGILVYSYYTGKVPPDERPFYRIKGYRELDEIQKEDIKTLQGKYVFGSRHWGLFQNTEIENLNTEFTMGEEIEFTDINHISFDDSLYQAVEICRFGREHYEELDLRPESLRRIGTKEVMEIRCEKKESGSDYFLLLVNANKDVFFVPPVEMRTGDDGYIYWVAYSLASVEQADF